MAHPVPEDGSNIFLRNFAIHLPDCMTRQPEDLNMEYKHRQKAKYYNAEQLQIIFLHISLQYSRNGTAVSLAL